ncbi:hypothetical protein KZ483_02240 [Paenibacillus sp. sptzw28]|uniref:hypothetical protein n=1 Tax=Paenibacillus sp. sptzw28 TaxID=715179 RepID=UPI001C6F028C|nr:hypothetical protein [Paenibacillus sp. sptzw28]QYR21881.1 hypothetical protein KZ483_02240 [Paenibacillus sp. sptzw28]
MSAFREFWNEKQEIDALLSEGYSVASVKEDLDGTKVRFVRDESSPEHAELLLLTADARKYVVSLIFERQRIMEMQS